MPGVCPKCSKNVYFAEEVKALGNVYHKLCFSCSACRKLLTSGNITEHDGQMFCNSCYRKNFGPKGYGFGGGAGTLSMDDGNGYKTNPNAVDHKAKAYVAPKKQPLETRKSSENIINEETKENGKENHGDKIIKPVLKTNGIKIKPKWGGADLCPRCGKPVFIAELMRAAGKAWHKSCFTCLICNKRVDSSMLCEREAEIYCRSCYGKNFGPKGVGFGIGAGTLTTN